MGLGGYAVLKGQGQNGRSVPGKDGMITCGDRRTAPATARHAAELLRRIDAGAHRAMGAQRKRKLEPTAELPPSPIK